MTSTAKKAVAEVAETMAAAALIDRGAPAVKARGGVTRMLRIVGPDGKPTGKLATHGEVLAGVAKAAEIQLAVADGKRPDRLICSDCRKPFWVSWTGPIPIKCKSCKQRERNKKYQQTASAKASLEKSRQKRISQRRTAGLCLQCPARGPRPAVSGGLCQQCKDARAIYRRGRGPAPKKPSKRVCCDHEALRAARIASNMTLGGVGERVDAIMGAPTGTTSAHHVWKYERGKRNPSKKKLAALASALGLTIEEASRAMA